MSKLVDRLKERANVLEAASAWGSQDGHFMASAASRIEQLERALAAAIEAMEADWMQIDGEWGPLFGGKFGNLEAAIAAGDKSAAAIRAARSALSGDEG